MKHKVSIIVPVYNAENFLDKGIESLLEQTYDNIEIVLINDGSKDSSLKIMKRWNKKHPDKIKVFSHTNRGVGKTRNRGIEVSTGEYITFVDADDYLEKDFVEQMMAKIANNDIIVSGYKKISSNGDVQFIQSLKEGSNWSKFRQVTVWSKIYKKELLVKNNIRYTDLKIAEDILFAMTTYTKTKKIYSTSYVGYVNVENSHSATHNNQLRIDNDMLKVLNMIDSEISKNRKFINNNLEEIKYFYLKIFTFFLFDKAKIMSYANLKIYYDSCMNWILEKYQKEGWKFKGCWQKDEPFKVNVAINIVIIARKLNIHKVVNRLVSRMFYGK